MIEASQWIWLAEGLGYGAANSGKILELFENPEGVRNALGNEDVSIYFSPMQIERLRMTNYNHGKEILQKCEKINVKVVTFEDDDYSKLLREIDNPPPVLYYRGDIKLLNSKLSIGVIGTRKPSTYGIQATQFISEGLAQSDIILASGLATGLDGEAHKIALKYDKPTIACIAFGHDNCYPASHKTLKKCIEDNGLVIGEYPPSVGAQKPFFLQRNRIIAGITRGVCVAEARKASGTMSTVSAAVQYNRDVFSVPGSIFSTLSEGTNALLSEGAIAVTSAADILTHYSKEIMAQPVKELKNQEELMITDTAKKVRSCLDYTPKDIYELCKLCGLDIGQIMSALTELEIQGLAVQQAGRRFIISE